MNEPNGAEVPREDHDADVAAILAAYLERFATEGLAALDDARTAHPALAPILAAQVEALAAAGLLRTVLPANDSRFPAQIGEFQLVRRIGGGGSGVVFEATQQGLGRPCALKLLRPEWLLFEGSFARFKREVDAVGRLSHPAIVSIHTTGEDQGIPFLAMELIRGCTLSEVLQELATMAPATRSVRDLARIVRARSGLPAGGRTVDARDATFGRDWIDACLRIVLQVAEALEHAHARKVLHRDVKPSNIMVLPDGRAKLIDFGLAWADETTRLTRSGFVPGSVPYMAPEQVRGERAAVDERTDVYGLGVTLYEALAGRPPYFVEAADETRRLVLEGLIPPIRERNNAVPWDVETVCLTAMDPDPMRRYGSARALAEDLQRLIDSRPILARRAGPLIRVRRWIRRHPTAAAVGGLLSILAVVAPIAFGVEEALARRAVTIERDLKEAERARAARLADLALTRNLLAQEPRLWPAVPELVAGSNGMDEWLRDAEALRARRALHRQTLAGLRAAGHHQDPPRQPGPLLRKRQIDEELQRLAWKRTNASRFAVGGLEETRRELGRAEAALCRERDEKVLWEFEDPDAARWNDVLVDLDADLTTVEALLESVKARRAFAASVDRVTITDQRAEWEAVNQALAAPAGAALYQGLRLPPQRGLIPLGSDPHSGLLEFAHLQSGAPAVRDPGSGELRLTAESGLVLVLIPGGSFWMGAMPPGPGPNLQNPDPTAQPDERPVRLVRLDPFFISKYEMTQSQWMRIAGTNPSESQPPEPMLPSLRAVSWLNPVERVTWFESIEVMRKLSLRLPTEAQWEYAARAGTATPWWCGADHASLLTPTPAGNLKDRRWKLGAPAVSQSFDDWIDDGFSAHAPVGSFRPNPFGLHDTLGNVCEWCLDGQDDYEKTDPTPGTGERWVNDRAGRAHRGGSWNATASDCRSATRRAADPLTRASEIGLRPARPLD